MTPSTSEIEAGLSCKACGEALPPGSRYFSISVVDCSTKKAKHPRRDEFREVTAIHSYVRIYRCAKCGPGEH